MKQYDVWMADLHPKTEPGTARPVVVIQSNLLNDIHPSSLICPVTTHIEPTAKILRVHLTANKENGLEKNADIMVDQIQTIDNTRLVEKIGVIDSYAIAAMKENLKNYPGVVRLLKCGSYWVRTNDL